MTVLVTAASKHGATLEIAEAIARVLAEQGGSAELVPIDEVSDLGRYDAVVLGERRRPPGDYSRNRHPANGLGRRPRWARKHLRRRGS